MARAFKDLEICKNYSHKDKVKILSFIDLLYNKKSELNKIQNVDERRTEAVRQAGLKSTEGLDSDEVKTLIFHYLSYYQQSNEFQLFFNDQCLYWDLQKEMVRPKKDEEESEDYYDFRLKISKQSSELLTRINNRRKELFDVEQIGKEAVEIVEDNVRMLRAEDRVTKQSP